MRVLIISSVYPTPEAPRIIGGAEVFTRQFAESLAASGDGVEVVRAASTPNQQMEIANGVTVYAAPVRNIYLPFSQQRSAPLRGVWHAVEDWQQTAALVSERIRAFRPDVMHSNNLSGLTTAVWKAAAEARYSDRTHPARLLSQLPAMLAFLGRARLLAHLPELQDPDGEPPPRHRPCQRRGRRQSANPRHSRRARAVSRHPGSHRDPQRLPDRTGRARRTPAPIQRSHSASSGG